MGVIYSTSKIREKSLPYEGSHFDAANQARDIINLVPDITTTLVHGSVPEGRSNIRSDLDVLVVYDDGGSMQRRADVEYEIGYLLSKTMASTDVVVEANIWPGSDSVAAIDARINDRLFARHLARSFNNAEWTRGPVDKRVIEIADRDHGVEQLRAMVMKYMTSKSDKFTKAPVVFNGDDQLCLLMMQRGLELPKSMGRKVADFTADLRGESTPKDHLAEINKHAEYVGEDVIEAVDELLRIDREYTELLMSFLDGSTLTTEQYEKYLKNRYNQVRRFGVIATGGFIRFVDKFGK